MPDNQASLPDSVPTLERSSKTFVTRDHQFAAVLVTDGTLTLESWDQSPVVNQVDFRFSDPEGRGRALELAYETGRDKRLMTARKYLLDKIFEINRAGKHAKQS